MKNPRSGHQIVITKLNSQLTKPLSEFWARPTIEPQEKMRLDLAREGTVGLPPTFRHILPFR